MGESAARLRVDAILDGLGLAARLFARSLALHVGWWLQAFGARARRSAPLGPGRLFFLFVLYPGFVLLQGVHWIAWMIDEILFPGYREVEPRDPVFVTGIPRSGTTFVHRLLAEDADRFTTMATWEVLLAPTVTQRRILLALGRVDRALGGFGTRLVDFLVARLFGARVQDVHPVGVDAPEEDYLALLPAAGCFGLVLAFPASRHLWSLGRPGSMGPAERDDLLRFYRACVQKHVFVHGGERRFLSKNAAFGSWVADLHRFFPGARFVLCIRDPLEGLSSQLASFEAARRIFGTDPDRTRFTRPFVDRFAQALVDLARVSDAPGIECAILDAEDLRAEPGATLREALARIGCAETPRLARAFADASRASADPSTPSAAGSKHVHSPCWFGLSYGHLPPELVDAYGSLRSRRVRLVRDTEGSRTSGRTARG